MLFAAPHALMYSATSNRLARPICVGRLLFRMACTLFSQTRVILFPLNSIGQPNALLSINAVLQHFDLLLYVVTSFLRFSYSLIELLVRCLPFVRNFGRKCRDPCRQTLERIRQLVHFLNQIIMLRVLIKQRAALAQFCKFLLKSCILILLLRGVLIEKCQYFENCGNLRRQVFDVRSEPVYFLRPTIILKRLIHIFLIPLPPLRCLPPTEAFAVDAVRRLPRSPSRSPRRHRGCLAAGRPGTCPGRSRTPSP